MQLYKVLGPNGESIHGGSGSWSLPHDGQPGEWMPELEPAICQRGYHLVMDPWPWFRKGATLWLAEVDTQDAQYDGNKGCFRSARLMDQVTRNHPVCQLDKRIKVWVDIASGAHLTRANLTGAYLTRANLTGAYLTGADLTGANLTGAYLTRANLTGAHLTGANLTGAYLTRANLTWANLTGAHLTWAHLTWADLTRANLTGANLTGANLTGAYPPSDVPDGWSVDADGRLVQAGSD